MNYPSLQKLRSVRHMIGTDLRHIKLEKYNPMWAEIFELNKHRIEEILKDFDDTFEIEHIGSTAIPTIEYSKPIIDISVRSQKDWITEWYNSGAYFYEDSAVVREIEKQGMYLKKDCVISGWGTRIQVINPRKKHFVHNMIHVDKVRKNPEDDAHMLFKRYMLEHPEEADIYSQLKVASVNKALSMNPQKRRFYEYCDFKDAFVHAINEKARSLYIEGKPLDWKFDKEHIEWYMGGKARAQKAQMEALKNRSFDRDEAEEEQTIKEPN
jgi:GrpB-like predicted nucleotidyltransferase (UPF0157 family)